LVFAACLITQHFEERTKTGWLGIMILYLSGATRVLSYIVLSKGLSAKTGWFGIGIMCPSEATCLPIRLFFQWTQCCLSAWARWAVAREPRW